MSSLESVLKRLKRQSQAYENELNSIDDEDGVIDVSLACSLADSVPYLIRTIENQQQEIERLKEDKEFYAKIATTDKKSEQLVKVYCDRCGKYIDSLEEKPAQVVCGNCYYGKPIHLDDTGGQYFCCVCLKTYENIVVAGRCCSDKL